MHTLLSTDAQIGIFWCITMFVGVALICWLEEHKNKRK